MLAPPRSWIQELCNRAMAVTDRDQVEPILPDYEAPCMKKFRMGRHGSPSVKGLRSSGTPKSCWNWWAKSIVSSNRERSDWRDMPSQNRQMAHQERQTSDSGGSPGHWCSANWSLRLSWASTTRFKSVSGTLNSRSHSVQIAIAGTVPSHLSTRRLRFGMTLFVRG